METRKKNTSHIIIYTMLNILFGLMMLLTLLSLFHPILYNFGIKIGTGQDLRVGLSPIASDAISKMDNGSPGYGINSLEGNLIVQQPEFWFSAISYMIPVLIGISFSYVTYLLRVIIKNVIGGNHFATENVKNTRIIAFLVILVPHIITIMQNILLSTLPRKLIIDGFEVYRMISAPIQIFSFVIMPDWLLAGLIVLVFAEIFKEGGAIKQENDLTV